ncbi:MAG: hypothetical protein KGZ39_02125 [Simkania sp.]|nr:hypothetical protein [Simkania sp.]
MDLDPLSQIPPKTANKVSKPSMPATVSKVAKMLNSYVHEKSTKAPKQWKQETDTSLYNKIESIAQMLRLQKPDIKT